MLDAAPGGKRIAYIEEKSCCPECRELLTLDHMFFDCPRIRHIWEAIHRLGRRHFALYRECEMKDVLTICDEYDPVALYHLSAIWAIWKHWCEFAFDEDFDTRLN